MGEILRRDQPLATWGLQDVSEKGISIYNEEWAGHRYIEHIFHPRREWTEGMKAFLCSFLHLQNKNQANFVLQVQYGETAKGERGYHIKHCGLLSEGCSNVTVCNRVQEKEGTTLNTMAEKQGMFKCDCVQLCVGERGYHIKPCGLESGGCSNVIVCSCAQHSARHLSCQNHRFLVQSAKRFAK